MLITVSFASASTAPPTADAPFLAPFLAAMDAEKAKAAGDAPADMNTSTYTSVLDPALQGLIGDSTVVQVVIQVAVPPNYYKLGTTELPGATVHNTGLEVTVVSFTILEALTAYQLIMEAISERHEREHEELRRR